MKTFTMKVCEKPQKWAEAYPTLEEAWQACSRPDWLIWLLGVAKAGDEYSRLRLIACDLAEAVLYLIPEGENRPRQAVEIARKFAIGEATHEELAAARATAGDAAEATWTEAGGAAMVAVYATMDDAWHSAAHVCYAIKGLIRPQEVVQCEIIRRYFPQCPALTAEYLEGAK